MINKKVKIEVPADILEGWQEIVDILSELADIPAALIMQYDEPFIEVFVSSNSEGNPYHVGDKEKLYCSGLYCEKVIKSQDKLLVPDALKDDDWKSNPDVKLNMISYLGFPVLLPDGSTFGTLCILDKKRNEYSETIEKLMRKFCSLIESHLGMAYMNQVLGDKNKQLKDYLMELQALEGFVTICANCKSIRDNQDNWHPVEYYLIKNPEADFTHTICPQCTKKLYPEYYTGH